MANSNGSQFFICSGAQSKNLNAYPNYNVFGKVTAGMDVVSQIESVPVAKKYAGQKDAEAKLFEKVKKGGQGVWGQVPMPPNPSVPDADLKALIKWVLSIK